LRNFFHILFRLLQLQPSEFSDILSDEVQLFPGAGVTALSPDIEVGAILAFPLVNSPPFLEMLFEASLLVNNFNLDILISIIVEEIVLLVSPLMIVLIAFQDFSGPAEVMHRVIWLKVLQTKDLDLMMTL